MFAGLVDADDCADDDPEVDVMPIEGGITPGGIMPPGIPPIVPPRPGGPDGAVEEDDEEEEVSEPPPLQPAIRRVTPKANAKDPHFINCLFSFCKGILRNAI